MIVEQMKQTDKNIIRPGANPAADHAAGGGLSRRAFLRLSGAAVAAGFLPVIAARAEMAGRAAGTNGAAQPADFIRLSAFLTGKPIAPQLAKRVWAALSKRDADFAGKCAELRQLIAAVNAPDIDMLKNRPEFSDAMRETAKAIISAYYLGYVGTPKPLRAHDDVEFITYTRALMYQLTYEHTPIPTYSRWGHDFWGSAVNPA